MSQPIDFPKALVQQLENAMHHLMALNEANDGLWHMGDAAWSVDQDAGKIVFDSDNFHVEAPVQIIGTYDTLSSTWLWGWDHPSVAPELARDAKRMHAYGTKNRFTLLTTRKFECDEDVAWQLTALACMLSKAQGAYRGPAGTTMVFFTFGEVELSKPR